MIGWGLRDVLKRLASPLTVRIRSGPLAGARWIATTSRKFIRGNYEPDTARIIEDLVAPGQVAFDIGAHAGYFTLLLSTCVGPKGRVVAFEPRPVNLHYLARHLALNHCMNVEIMKCAVADRDGESGFSLGTGTGTGHLSDNGARSVETATLDRLVGNGQIPAPDFIKIDVEGAEQLIMEGARDVISRHRPKIIVDLHGRAAAESIRAFLGGFDYSLKDVGKRTCVFAMPPHRV